MHGRLVPRERPACALTPGLWIVPEFPVTAYQRVTPSLSTYAIIPVLAGLLSCNRIGAMLRMSLAGDRGWSNWLLLIRRLEFVGKHGDRNAAHPGLARPTLEAGLDINQPTCASPNRPHQMVLSRGSPESVGHRDHASSQARARLDDA